jgi:hypothetical protein
MDQACSFLAGFGTVSGVMTYTYRAALLTFLYPVEENDTVFKEFRNFYVFPNAGTSLVVY